LEAFNIRHFGLDPESRISVWIPAFAGMTTMIYPNIYATFRFTNEIPVKIEGHLFGQGKRRRDFKFEGVYESRAISSIDSLGIQRRPGRLEQFQVTVDHPYSHFFPFGDLGYGQSVGAGLNCPDNPPLPG